MTGKTHIQCGLSLIPIVNILYPISNFEEVIILYIITGISAILPDMDSKESFAANAIWGIDDLLRKIGLFKHRGITHFNIRLKNKNNKWIMHLIRYMIIGFFAFTLLTSKSIVYNSIITGYCSHIVLDDITTIFGIKTGSKFENKYVYNLFGLASLIGLFMIISSIIGLKL